MKLDKTLLLIVYMLGINFYFVLWYLGSEGTATVWRFDRLSYHDLILATNLTALFVFFSLWFFSWIIKKQSDFNVQADRFGSLIQLTTGTVLYILSYYGFIRLLLLGSSSSVHDFFVSFLFLSLIVYHQLLLITVLALNNLGQRLGGIVRAFSFLFKLFSIPSHQNRGFLFIDLNHSTSIAEKLGNEKYSQLLQSCFRLLEQIVEKYDRHDIYQYVGDEAIIHWDYNDKINNMRSIQLFYDFKKSLISQSNYFMSEFGLQPTFKGAMHGGDVIQTEMGKSALHMAFHGDVLNTTSRILGLCHQNRTDLLISENCHQQLNTANLTHQFIKIEDVFIIGKERRLTVFKPFQAIKATKNFYTLKMTNSQ